MPSLAWDARRRQVADMGRGVTVWLVVNPPFVYFAVFHWTVLCEAMTGPGNTLCADVCRHIRGAARKLRREVENQMPTTTLTPDGRTLIHHSRCGGVFGPECRCPESWPRLQGDQLITHRWNGNCLRGDTRRGGTEPALPLLCVLHGEPRGSCSRCKPCGGCEAGKRAQEALQPAPFVLFVEPRDARGTYCIYAIDLHGACLTEPVEVDARVVHLEPYVRRGWLDEVRARIALMVGTSHARPLNR
jgi:hypothetical protein